MSAADMPAGVTGKTKKRQQSGIDAKHDSADAHAETRRKSKCQNCIPPQKSQDHQR